MYIYRPIFAQVYGTSTYGCGAYQVGCSTTTSSGGSLVNTGSPWFIPVMLGGALIIAAIILIVTKVIRRHKTNKD